MYRLGYMIEFFCFLGALRIVCCIKLARIDEGEKFFYPACLINTGLTVLFSVFFSTLCE
jgi:hypothetical protein